MSAKSILILFVAAVWALVLGALASLCPAQAIIQYPDDAGVINVKLPPYSAAGDGVTDDTAALQKALLDASGRIVFFPDGTYMVHDTLRDKRPTPGNDHDWFSHVTLVGHDAHRSIIRFFDNTFTDPAHPNYAGIYESGAFANGNADGGGDTAFSNNVRNLTFDVGRGNYACGLNWMSNNRGTIRDVTIVDGDNLGPAGLMLDRSSCGPGLVRNLHVVGFREGVFMQGYYGLTFIGLTCEGQSGHGVLLNGTVSCAFERYRSTQTQPNVPALAFGVQDAMAYLVDCQFAGPVVTPTPVAAPPAPSASPQVVLAPSPAPTPTPAPVPLTPAITGNGWYYGRRVSVQGYAPPALPLATLPQADGRTSSPLGLPEVDTPEIGWPLDFSRWANVTKFALPTDDNDSPAVQRAIDSGAQVVYFPWRPQGYNLSRSVVVRGAVRLIEGCESEIHASNYGFNPSKTDWDDSTNVLPLFRFEGVNVADGPVVFENAHLGDGSYDFNGQAGATGCVAFEDATLRPLIIRSVWEIIGGGAYRNVPGQSGAVFLEDFSCSGHRHDTISSVYQTLIARQLNTEAAPKDQTPHLTVDGGRAWIFGYKAEDADPLVRVVHGGAAEIGGAWWTITRWPTGQPAFSADEQSQLSVMFATVNGSQETRPRFVEQQTGYRGGKPLFWDVAGAGGPPGPNRSSGRENDQTNYYRVVPLWSTPH